MQTTPPGQAPVAGVPAVQVPLPLQDAGVVVSWLPLQEVVPVQDVPAEAATPIGVACRLCHRADCTARSAPPIGRQILPDDIRHTSAPFGFSD